MHITMRPGRLKLGKPEELLDQILILSFFIYFFNNIRKFPCITNLQYNHVLSQVVIHMFIQYKLK